MIGYLLVSVIHVREAPVAGRPVTQTGGVFARNVERPGPLVHAFVHSVLDLRYRLIAARSASHRGDRRKWIYDAVLPYDDVQAIDVLLKRQRFLRSATVRHDPSDTDKKYVNVWFHGWSRPLPDRIGAGISVTFRYPLKKPSDAIEASVYFQRRGGGWVPDLRSTEIRYEQKGPTRGSVSGPERTPVANARIAAKAMLHLHRDILFGRGSTTEDVRPWQYEPGSLTGAEAQALEPMMRSAGLAPVSRGKSAATPEGAPFVFIDFAGWRHPTTTRLGAVVGFLYRTRGADVSREGSAVLYFDRTRKGWILDEKATEYTIGE